MHTDLPTPVSTHLTIGGSNGTTHGATPQAQTAPLISPYGGSLVNLLVPPEAHHEVKSYASQLPSIQLSERAVCDLELLATGAFSPLDRFMSQEDYQRVVYDMRLTSGHLFPIPVTLPVAPGPALRLDRDIALRDARSNVLAVLTINDIYTWDYTEVARKVFGTLDLRHPLVTEMRCWGPLHLSGQLRVLQLPQHYDFRPLRLTPRQTRMRLAASGFQNVIAFQTHNPLRRVHEELTKRATKEVDGVLLLHPVVGMPQPGDVVHYTRMRAYKALAACYYDRNRMLLSLLPLVMRMAGPREALWHALIRRNYGANYLIVERDHASPGVDSAGKPFYDPYAAQELLGQFSAELGVGVVPFCELVSLPDEDRYEEISRVPAQACTASIAGTHRQGVCIWFTGLSGAGKSTTAEALTVLLLEHGRQATVLDGDVVRTHLSKGLGFGKEDRDTNVRRIGFVAAEIVRHGGVVICAAVSPYQATRNHVRHMIGPDQFLEVFVDTPLEVCEGRDVKGMYAKARRGEIKDFTGVDDPYEPPLQPEITLDTVAHLPEENATLILQELIHRGFVREPMVPCSAL
jgi:sulfate adenylyltransferase